jgi:hypothetical protein
VSSAIGNATVTVGGPLGLPGQFAIPLLRRRLAGADRPAGPRGTVTQAGATDPLDTIPPFDVKIPLTPARGAAIRRALAALDTIPAECRELDLREHRLITSARTTGGHLAADRHPPRLQGPAGRPTAPPGPHPDPQFPVADAPVTALTCGIR